MELRLALSLVVVLLREPFLNELKKCQNLLAKWNNCCKLKQTGYGAATGTFCGTGILTGTGYGTWTGLGLGTLTYCGTLTGTSILTLTGTGTLTYSGTRTGISTLTLTGTLTYAVTKCLKNIYIIKKIQIGKMSNLLELVLWLVQGMELELGLGMVVVL